MIEMIGIGFNGYMIGTFGSLFASIVSNDQLDDHNERLDHWLIAIDKARSDILIPGYIVEGVRNYHANKFKYDAMEVQNSQFF